ncbi:hypothetical protein GWI33_015438 [Rhynchophorus ferrugineus]|uniref:Large ribosomal subunit protein mL62 n=1 Tax=Rhynchophorus ferrugineus TaxID=354439 RepID=A0A834I2L0_RHYFE|nr:hypothetical protein GWI33_015438 [Rhynchophorus ferrugineus]
MFNIISNQLKCSGTKISFRSVGYQSALALSNLYPESSLKIKTLDKPQTKISEEFSGFIPIDQLQITYSRSTGPGGQNVNKVNTKVDVRFHLQSATWLSDEVKSKITEKFGSKLTKEGHLIFRSDVTRSQQLNLADCLQKLRQCIITSLQVKPEPSPESEEKKRKAIEKANRMRLAMKRERIITVYLKQNTDNRTYLKAYNK